MNFDGKIIARLFLPLFSILLLLYVIFSNYEIGFPLRHLQQVPPVPMKKKDLPPILIWNSRFIHGRMLSMLNRGFPGYPSLSDTVKCPFRCEFTDDKKRENASSMLIFLLHEKCPMEGWPPHRRADQSYVLFTVESPANTLPHYDRRIMTDRWFNATVTYRRDSTVPMPYDALSRIASDTPRGDIWTEEEVLAKVRNKSRFAFQVVSHCGAESGRDLLTKRLGKLIPIDLAGACYGVGCDNNCYWGGMDSHFFYLAFENSVCPQYVTEKFWKSLRALAVPIVLRRSVLAGIDIPQSAFIAVDDFGTVEELADHLKALRNDTKRYLKYFEWTKIYRKSHFGTWNSPFCKLCEFAHRQYEEGLTETVDLNKFWTTKDCDNGFVQKFLLKND